MKKGPSGPFCSGSKFGFALDAVEAPLVEIEARTT